MEPGLRRWLTGTALGCAAIAVAYLPPLPVDRTSDYLDLSRTPERRLERRIDYALTSARTRIDREDRTAMLLQRIREGEVTGKRADLWLRGAFSPRSANLIGAAFDSLMREVPPDPSGMRLVLMVDQASQGGILWAFPHATRGNACGVSMSAGILAEPRGEETHPWRVQMWMANGLSRCAYYAAYGRPGPEIEAWLKNRLDLGARYPWSGDSIGDGEQRPLPLLVRAFEFAFRGDSDDPDAIACARGEPGRCRAEILDLRSERNRGYGTLENGVLTASEGIRFFFYARSYLEDLRRNMGPERFARFWRSPLPVDSAFIDAFGVDLETWTVGWHRSHNSFVPRKTAVGFLAGLQGILVIGLAYAVAAGFARRRVVT